LCVAGGGTNATANCVIDLVALELQDPTWSLPSFINATGNGANRWTKLTYESLSDAFDRGVALFLDK
jgi:hypothetical protein